MIRKVVRVGMISAAVVLALPLYGQGLRDVKVMMQLNLYEEGSQVVSYEQIAPLLHKYACTTCHYGSTEDPTNVDATVDDIDMRSFPFGLNKKDADGNQIYATQAELVEASMGRFYHEDPSLVMPQQPGGDEVPLVSEEDNALFGTWADSGLLARPEGLPPVADVVKTVMLNWKNLRDDSTGSVELVLDAETGLYTGWVPNGRRRTFELSVDMSNELGEVISSVPVFEQRFAKREAKYFHQVEIAPLGDGE